MAKVGLFNLVLAATEIPLFPNTINVAVFGFLVGMATMCFVIAYFDAQT